MVELIKEIEIDLSKNKEKYFTSSHPPFLATIYVFSKFEELSLFFFRILSLFANALKISQFSLDLLTNKLTIH